MKVIML